MFPCSHSSARLNKASYETGHYKIGPPWSFKKPFLSPSPHWTFLFWTHSVRCGHSFSERLEGQKCFLVTTAALQRFQSPAFSLCSNSTSTGSMSCPSHGPLQAFLPLPGEYWRGHGLPDLAISLNRAGPCRSSGWSLLASRKAVIPPSPHSQECGNPLHEVS